jgi:hypothetical protein
MDMKTDANTESLLKDQKVKRRELRRLRIYALLYILTFGLGSLLFILLLFFPFPYSFALQFVWLLISAFIYIRIITIRNEIKRLKMVLLVIKIAHGGEVRDDELKLRKEVVQIFRES